MDTSRIDMLLSAACNYQARCLEQRDLCNSKYRAVETNEENILRFWIDGLIATLALLMADKIVKVTPADSYQIAVSASYVRTHFIVNDFIMQGDLVEAMTLLRKQLESLARLHELDSKPLNKIVGKVPNIQNVLKGGAGRIYGDLSAIAHFAKPEVGELLHVFEKDELVGPSILPVYSDRSHACFDLQSFVSIYFLAWFIEKLHTWYPQYDHTKDKECLACIILTAKDVGVIRFDEK